MQIYCLGIYQLHFKENRLCYGNHNVDNQLRGSHDRDYTDLSPGM
jgi:hypothetical protein